MNIPQENNAKTGNTWKNFWDKEHWRNFREKARKYIPLALFIVVGFVFAKYFNIASLKEFLDSHEKLGYLVILCGYLLLGATVIPSDPLTILVIAWKGPAAAVILDSIGNTLSSIVEYYIGGSIGDLADFEKQKAKLPFHLGQLPVDSPVFLILGRLVNGYLSKLVSVAAGAYQVPMFTYVWTSLVANLIGTTVFVCGGYGLLKLLSQYFPWFPKI